MLDLLAFVLELLPDFLIEYLLGKLWLGLQEFGNWIVSRL
jgi:hypothetical protein